MKEYLAPEFEKIEYTVEECLTSSSNGSNVIGREGKTNTDDAIDGI